MFFQNKVDRAFKWLKDKNKAIDGNDEKDHDEDMEIEEDVSLEKTDYLAMFISAVMVFAPIFIILLVIAIWAFM